MEGSEAERRSKSSSPTLDDEKCGVSSRRKCTTTTMGAGKARLTHADDEEEGLHRLQSSFFHQAASDQKKQILSATAGCCPLPAF